MRVPALLLLLPLLAGCTDTDWNGLMSFGSRDRAEVAEAAAPADVPAATAAATPAPPASAVFCQDVARQDAAGFDAATQQRIAQRSYQQCLTIFGN